MYGDLSRISPQLTVLPALDESEAASEQQLEQIEELEQTLFELRGEIGAGRHVPPGIRILSLKDNPAQQWSDLRQEVMDRLKGENEALINRLKELEDSGAGQAAAAKRGDGPGEDLVPRRSWEVVNQEKHELEEVVKQKEKRLLRLQQVGVFGCSPSWPDTLLMIPCFRISCRSLQPRAQSSAKPSPLSWASSSLSTPTAKYASRRSTT